MTKLAVANSLNETLADDRAHAARVAACRSVAAALSELGAASWVGSWVFRDSAGEGLAILTEMGAELATGAVQLFDQEIWYAGSALVRQLIEVEYLAARVAEDPDAAATWLASSPAELRQAFAPSAIRKASGGRFRAQEYSVHCEHGGHPSPHGRVLLKNHSNPLGSRRWHWADLAQHLDPLWTDLCRCLWYYSVVV